MNTGSNRSSMKSSQALIEIYESLNEQGKQSLSDFADFLQGRAGTVVKPVPPPDEIPRPEIETVVGAIKRLKSKYHMLESMSVFSAASALMTDHMVKGRDAVEVIDEMEALFESAYIKLLQQSGQDNSE